MILLPEQFEQAMRQQLGTDFPDFLSSLQEAPPVSIRLHPIKGKKDTMGQLVGWSKYGQYLSARPFFTLDPLFHGGSYYVQEASSMFLEQALTQTVDLSKPLNVLDLCAAPGGKSTHLLSLLNRESLLVSNEAIRSRASVLSENIQKWGYPNAVVTSNDPADFGELPGFFDVVVVDAPCSGEGLFRKEPDAVAEWSPENVQLCSSRQRRIFADVWNALKEDGIFIYCTCTYNALENEDNLKWLFETASAESLKITTDPSWGVEEVVVNNIYGYRFYPHKTKGEGFFLSVVRKREPIDGPAYRTKKRMVTPLKQISERLKDWVRYPHDSTVFQFNDLLFLLPSAKAELLETLLDRLKILYAGTNIARLKHDKLVPEHTLALSVELNKANFPCAEVSEADALKYLRRDTIQLNGQTGFTLLTYRDLPIGWANVLSNRVNNMYPSEWRIRMQ